MRSNLREAVAAIRQAGGTNVAISEGGRHTEVAFIIAGRTETVRLHRGSIETTRATARLRSQLRRKVEGRQ